MMNRRHFVAQVVTAGTVPPLTRAPELMDRIKPPRLRPGNTIGLVTPSRYATEAQLRASVMNLKKLGFRAKFTPNMLVRKGYLAGTDAQRADDLNRMFAGDGPVRHGLRH